MPALVTLQRFEPGSVGGENTNGENMETEVPPGMAAKVPDPEPTVVAPNAIFLARLRSETATPLAF